MTATSPGLEGGAPIDAAIDEFSSARADVNDATPFGARQAVVRKQRTQCYRGNN
jgi:hypothetical protein